MNAPRVLTGIDLPYGSPGGSIELFTDLYLAAHASIPADVFMLSGDVAAAMPTNLKLLDVAGKSDSGAAYGAYIRRLAEAVRIAFADDEPNLLHLHHLAFGASPALIAAFPNVPAVAFIHGTDLLAAQANPDQHKVLLQVAEHADSIVAPTPAMANRLLRLAPKLEPNKIHLISWGIPEELLTVRPRQQQGHRLPRLLYAGRLSPEKGFDGLATACAANGIPVSVAAPGDQWHLAKRRLGSSTRHLTYLGWFTRRALWEEFGRHDALAIPSLDLEAFCLTAIEAQAAGLPVLYRAVDGLSDVLGSSAMPVDLHNPAALARTCGLLRSGALREELSDRGRVNAARYTLAATVSSITALGRRVVAAHTGTGGYPR